MYPGRIGNNRINKASGSTLSDIKSSDPKETVKGIDFNELLAVKIGSSKKLDKSGTQKNISVESKLTFSAHATKRMVDRNIDFSDFDRQKLENLVEKVRKKGGKDALVMMKKAGFLVSVKNSKVITVLDSQQLKSNVITNIDAAVIA